MLCLKVSHGRNKIDLNSMNFQTEKFVGKVLRLQEAILKLYILYRCYQPDSCLSYVRICVILAPNLHLFLLILN